MPETVMNARLIRLVPVNVDRAISPCHFPIGLQVPDGARPTYFRRILKDRATNETLGILYCVGYEKGNRRMIRAVDPAMGGVLCLEELRVGNGIWNIVSKSEIGT